MKKAVLFLVVLGAFILFATDAMSQPTVGTVYLDASSPDYSTNDNLTASYTTGGSAVAATVTWSIDGSPFSLLQLPFEAGDVNALEDFSGSGNHVTPGGNPSWSSTAGHGGTGAFMLDGNDYFMAGDILPLDGSYTKSAWIYITYEEGYRNIISSSVNVMNNHSLRVDENGNLTAGHNAGLYNVRDSDSLYNDTWYFVAVTFDYPTGEMTLYKDGVIVDQSILDESLRSVIDGNVLIGSKEYSFFFHGVIDDVRIYDRALSSVQIASMYSFGGDRVVGRETHGGEDWQVCVTPFSDSEVGSEGCSSTHTLQSAGISGLSLAASSPDNLIGDDITASFSSNASVVETATAWFNNGDPLAVLYLPFEGGETEALQDYSGSGNHVSKPGTANENPTWNHVGHDGNGAFSFDGSDYLIAGDIFPLGSSYTKTAWINNSVEGFRNIMSSSQRIANNHTFKLLPDRRLNAGHSLGDWLVIDPDPILPDVWYFVAVTFDYETGQMTLYKNGAIVDQAIVPVNLRDIVDPSVLIGSLAYDYEWVGSIDDPRIYARALSPEQISALYAGNDLLVSEETIGGDAWHVEVTPFSSSEAGSTMVSNVVEIYSIFIADIDDQNIDEGSTFASINLDSYMTLDEFTEDDMVWTSSGESDITVSIDPVTHWATLTLPNTDWYGSEDITFTATNPNGHAASNTANFTVQNINDPPVIVEIGDQSTNEDVNLTGLSVDFDDADPTDSHTITVESDEINVTVANLSGNTYDLVPAGNWYGTAQITVTVTDDGTGPLSDVETYTLTVDPVNDAPVLVEIGNQSTNEDTDLNGLTVVFSDQEAFDTHTITVVSDEPNVTVTGPTGNASGATYNLVPAADWNGTAGITVTVTDDGTGQLSDVETYTLTVDPVNDAPVIVEIGNQTTFEDIPLTGLSVVFNDPDAGDSHTILVSSLEPNVSVVGPSGNTSGSTYDLVPAPNWIGSAQITVTVTETGGSGLSDTEIYAFNVGAVNDAPVLTEIGDQSTDEDTPLTGLSVVFSDLDPTDEHVITVVSSEPGVSVVNLIGNVSGSTYDLVPDADWNGSSQITVTVTDNGTGNLFDSETYTLTVQPINDAPAHIDLSNSSVDENVPVGTVVGQLISTDADASDTHTYTFMFEGGDEEIDNQFFLIDGAEVKVHSEMDYELKNSFSLLIQSDDGNGGTLTQVVPVTVNNIVETSIGDESESLLFTVYPVPAFDRLTVEVENPENEQLLLEIYSNSGMLMHSEHTVHGNTIDVNEFAKGMYILRIRGEGFLKTRKIVIGDR